MTEHLEDPTLRTLRKDVRRLRHAVVLLAAPWLLVALGALRPDAQEVVTARRFVVVDEQGMARAELSAPTVQVQLGPAPFVEQAAPQLMLTYDEGPVITVGGPTAGILMRNGASWASVRASAGVTIGNEYEGGEAYAHMDPWNIAVTATRDEAFHQVSLETWAGADKPALVISDGDRSRTYTAEHP